MRTIKALYPDTVKSIGAVKIPVLKIASGEHIAGWFDIIGTSVKLPKSGLDMVFEFCAIVDGCRWVLILFKNLGFSYM